MMSSLLSCHAGRTNRVEARARGLFLHALAALVGWLGFAQTGWCDSEPAASRAAWPPVTEVNKPWAYWHWMGSAVDEANLSRELQRYAAAGLGGMHVIPIYGAKGWESRYVPYLSPRWLELFGYTVETAHRLGLDIDMTTGTGWNFGGPAITEEFSCERIERQKIPTPVGMKPAELLRAGARLLAVLAESSSGAVLDLTSRVSARGEVDWVAPDQRWTIEIVTAKSGLPAVKRPAPGGEGPMLNPFYLPAMEHYLARFDSAFAASGEARPRSMYNDSYEYHDAAWSPDLYEQFARRRGYRLEAHRAELFGPAASDEARRVRADYRETLSDLLLESMTRPWVDWAHRHGFLTRDQAHGSPGNLLDLYAAADIPETEMFSKDRDILISKFASSAAHVAGHQLVAAETGTWVAEHFTETLADLKRNADDLLLSGVNHVFYHATCYSPDEAPWPGWLFYASTEMNPRNPIWRDVPALNAYVQACQSLLQAGKPANDVLVYWPIHDLWYMSEPLVVPLTVHDHSWLQAQPVGRAAGLLWSRGWSFDYASDRQLCSATMHGSRIATAGGTFQTVLVPRCRQIPLPTMRSLLSLARNGATIVFEGGVPNDVPGLYELETRRRELHNLVDDAKLVANRSSALRDIPFGRGRVIIGDIEPALNAAAVSRETLTDCGFRFVRRTLSDGACYYLVNEGGVTFSGWLNLSTPEPAAMLLDPMTRAAGVAATRASENRLEVFVTVEPGQAIFVRTLHALPPKVAPWRYWKKRDAPIALTGNWHVQFIAGGPDRPADFNSTRLGSWTQFGGDATQRFAGTARYTLTFDAPVQGRQFLLTLGKVAQSARVYVNGRDFGVLFMPPFQVPVGVLKPVGNVLEVDVTSVAANRIRDLDRRAVEWKTFHDANIVSIDYKPFDASHWPLYDAGLLGPVALQPIEDIAP